MNSWTGCSLFYDIRDWRNSKMPRSDINIWQKELTRIWSLNNRHSKWGQMCWYCTVTKTVKWALKFGQANADLLSIDIEEKIWNKRECKYRGSKPSWNSCCCFNWLWHELQGYGSICCHCIHNPASQQPCHCSSCCLQHTLHLTFL